MSCYYLFLPKTVFPTLKSKFPIKLKKMINIEIFFPKKKTVYSNKKNDGRERKHFIAGWVSKTKQDSSVNGVTN